ncbi:MAG: T9SS type A sorting domain-containing protein [Saprospiraceae bacterium]|nr:T9SS type A sorting domain-containing protein [Saprospiraceae bacterium]
MHTDVVSGDNTISLNMEDVTPGVYFVRLATEEGRSTRKIVIE